MFLDDIIDNYLYFFKGGLIRIYLITYDARPAVMDTLKYTYVALLDSIMMLLVAILAPASNVRQC